MRFESNGKNPNELHDYLITNDCIPVSLTHNAVYDESGEKVEEATEINIEVESEKEMLLSDLVSHFMA